MSKAITRPLPLSIFSSIDASILTFSETKQARFLQRDATLAGVGGHQKFKCDGEESLEELYRNCENTNFGFPRKKKTR